MKSFISIYKRRAEFKEKEEKDHVAATTRTKLVTFNDVPTVIDSAVDQPLPLQPLQQPPQQTQLHPQLVDENKLNLEDIPKPILNVIRPPDENAKHYPEQKGTFLEMAFGLNFQGDWEKIRPHMFVPLREIVNEKMHKAVLQNVKQMFNVKAQPKVTVMLADEGQYKKIATSFSVIGIFGKDQVLYQFDVKRFYYIWDTYVTELIKDHDYILTKECNSSIENIIATGKSMFTVETGKHWESWIKFIEFV